VVSYIDGGLETNNNYELMDFTLETSMKGFDSGGFENILGFSYSGENYFNESLGKYTYSSSGQEYLMIPVEKNTASSVKYGEFILSVKETLDDGDFIRKILIDEEFSLPAVNIDLSEESVEVGNKFVYTENGDLVSDHFTEYKKQEYLLRISRRGTASDYNVYSKSGQIRRGDANANLFLQKTTNYIDFRFDGDDYGQVQEESTSYGINAKFVPGNIRVGGLPNGSYTLTLYSIRYSSSISNQGYMVITKEDTIDFTADDIDTSKDIIVDKLYEGNHKNITIDGVVISNTALPSINLREVYGASSTNIIPNIINFTPMTEYYVDSSTVITLGVGGYDASTGKYYNRFSLDYDSAFETKDNISRYVYITSGSTEVVEEYKVSWSTLPLITSYPHQTVVALYGSSKDFGSDPYEIVDNGMSKYTYGYRGVKYVSGTNIDSILNGSYTTTLQMSFDDDTYLWQGSSGNQTALIINKAVSDSKGSYYRTGASSGSYLDFYTNNNLQEFVYEEETSMEKDDNATFTWVDSPQNSNDVIISDDRLVFRISKIADGTTGVESKDYYVRGTKYTANVPEFYIDLYNNLNPIGTFVEKTAIEEFVAGSRNYVDLVFTKGEDREVEGGDSVFTFSKDNSFKINGLPRGNYMLQVYSIKNPDLETQRDPTIDYRTFTFEFYKKFEMGLPTLATGDFANRNNLFMIDSINVYSSFDESGDIPQPIKDIHVNFVTKAEQLLYLTTANLVAENTEEGGTGHSMSGHRLAEWHEESGGEAVLSMDLDSSEQSQFQFPLDIVFVVDNSGSMQPHIDRVKEGLTAFTQNLNARGFDVKYNMVTFGPPQTYYLTGFQFFGRWYITSIGNPVGDWDDEIYLKNDYINTSSYYQSYPHVAKYKEVWFDSLSETIDAFDNISAIYGYPYGQENGPWAIYYGIEHLKDNGRYLDSENNIVEHSEGRDGDIPSQKWIIFLTDENFDDDNISSIPTISGYTAFKNYFINSVEESGITVTGIYHIRDSSVNEQDDLGVWGAYPSDNGDRHYNELRDLVGTDVFARYELGSSGENSETALLDSVKSVGIIQRWILKYKSPFNMSDGFKREVVFSLDEIYDTGGDALIIEPYIRDHSIDRYYRVPSEKVEAYFSKPSSSNSDFVKQNGKIAIEVLARSQYNEIDEDGNTQLTNYKIEKGIIGIKSADSGNSIVLSSSYGEVDIIPYGNGWYKLIALLDAEEFEEKFGIGRINIEATAATKENGKTISMTNLGITEEDSPIIKEVTLTNNSLFELLTALKDEYGNSIYSDTEANELSTITYRNNDGITLSEIQTYFATEANRLPVKIGDTISYVLNVQDESIDNLNDTNIVIGDSVAVINLIGSTYSGTAILNSNDTFINITIEDDYGNTSLFKDGSGNPADIPVLTYPNLINSISFEEGEYFSAVGTGSTDTNRAIINTSTEIANALAYIIVFEYDNTYSDGIEYDNVNPPINTSSYLDNGVYWASSKDNAFSLVDGKYLYKEVLVVGRSGQVYSGEITIADVLGIAKNELLELEDENKESFYVDTVAPRVTATRYTKVEDSNGVLIGGDNVKVKTGDEFEFVFTLEEKNPDAGTLISGGSNVSYISSTVDDVLNEMKEKYSVTYSEIQGERNLSFDFEIADKAGNITESTVSLTYNSYSPRELRIQGDLIGNGIKFTANTEYYLNTINNEVYNSLGYADINGIFRPINSLPVSINYFGLVGIPNANNDLSIINYSESGMSYVGSDSIVVDNTINGGSLGETKGITTNGLDYTATISFGGIYELVGLDGFLVNTSGIEVEGGFAGVGGYYPLTGGTYSTTPITSTYNENYILKFQRNIPGDYLVDITLRDRLGNISVMTLKIKISNVLKLKGKKEGSTIENESSVEIYEGIDIKDRKR
jgi:hypothetical protein